MAEDLLGEILGGDDERQEIEAVKADIDPLIAPITMAGAERAGQVDPDTATYIKAQTRLVELQISHFEHERRLGDSATTARLLIDRLKLVVQGVVTAGVILAACGVIFLIVEAINSQTVIIQPFDISPSLATQSLTGKIVAASLLDELTRIQAATRSNAKARSLSNAWTNQIEIEVPETGVSIGQVEKVLKERLGHDQHIDGDLVRTKTGGLALTVRGDTILPKTFSDEKGDLNALLVQAGEYAYSQSQPSLWTAYLEDAGRADEAIKFAQATYAKLDPGQKAYVLNVWANAIVDKGEPNANRRSLELYREALRLKPDYWAAYNNVMNALITLGDEEGAVAVAKQMTKMAGGRPGRAPDIYYENYDTLLNDLQKQKAEQVTDLQAHGGLGTMNASIGSSTNLEITALDIALHDVTSAQVRLATISIDDKNPIDVATYKMVQAELADERGDVQAAASAWDAYAAAYANPTIAAAQTARICSAAPSLQRVGLAAKADAALNAVNPKTFVDCYGSRADVLDLRGDWPGAQAWYVRAVKLGPSLPDGYYAWGMALARHGDLDDAVAKFEAATEKGPHWADPLKAWGDVLARKGLWGEALARYDSALKYAPAWPQLRQARDLAAKHAGGF